MQHGFLWTKFFMVLTWQRMAARKFCNLSELYITDEDQLVNVLETWLFDVGRFVKTFSTKNA